MNAINAPIDRPLCCQRAFVAGKGKGRPRGAVRRFDFYQAFAAAGMTPSVAVILWLHVENGSKFTRGKQRVREDIDYLVTRSYEGSKLSDTEYRLVHSAHR